VSNTAISSQLQNVLDRLQGVVRVSGGFQAKCPCRNDDENPSFSISEGESGKVVVYCHAGRCDTKQACESMGITMSDLYPPKQAKKLELVAKYRYLDETGTLLFEKLRYLDSSTGKKEFRQRKPDGKGGWEYKLGDTPRVLYNLPEVIKAKSAGAPIWVVEGEKDADTLVKMGICATTMPNGAGTWLPIHTEALAGAVVEIIADNDEAGLKHAKGVYEELADAGCDAQVWVCKKGKDITEHVAMGGAIEELQQVDLGSISNETKEQVRVVSDTHEGRAINEISDLLDRDDMSESQKLSRAQLIISRTSSTKIVDTGRLVSWSDFVNETDDDSYDWVIPGLLERNERVIVVAAEGVGKRATIDSVIPTPSGWTTLGGISVGDEVIDRFGNPVNVTYVSPIEPNPDAYRVTFSDGNFIDADAEHQWYTETLNEREKRKIGKVRTTAEIRDTLISNRSTKAFNHAIPTTKPLNLPEVKLPIAPYTLGAWLGDGTTIDGSICSEDEEVLESIRNDGYVVRKRESTPNMYGILGLQAQLKECGLYGNKHIPAIYSRASYEQRLALVQGLMDTDGYVRTDGLCEFSVTHYELAKGFLDLILTLGVKATMREGDSTLYGRVTGTRYRISFKTDLSVCRLKRKVDRLPEKLKTLRSLYRYIVSVEPITPVPMRCISVDGPDNTYLIGDAYIPTHNTMLARQVAICVGMGIHPFTYQPIRPQTTLSVDLENPERIIRRTSRSIYSAAYSVSKNDKPQAHLLIKPQGLNLLLPEDRAVLEEMIEKTQPAILVMGPLYKSFIDPGGRTSEAVAIEVARYLDAIRDIYQCAMWLEHHAPLGTSMTTRELRPFGSAVWSRWPEFGISLQPDSTGMAFHYDIRHFRGARDERQWPTRIKRGKRFPFEVVDWPSSLKAPT
jgi:5S rRNA maturation endonuclease (ribonuclease M5)